MPVYEYQAINKSGKNVKGTIDADSLRQARSRLRDQKIFPTNLNETSSRQAFNPSDITKYFRSNSLSQKDLSITTRQMATLVGAGLPLVSALTGLSEQSENETIRRIIVAVREDVEEGHSLSVAMEKFPRAFPRLYISMIASGEASGTLDTVLSNLAEHLEEQVALVNKVKAAMMYPVVMLFICVLVIIGLFVFLVPKIVVIFTKQGATLPLPTRITMAISNFLLGYWWLVLIMLVAAILGFIWYYRTEPGRAVIDRFLLKLPIFGKIYQKVYTARTAQTLGTLLASGVQMLTALEISQKIVGNVHVVSAMKSAKEGVREGKSLAAEFKSSKLFPSMLIQMMAVGEKSGELESMLQKAGEAYKAEVNTTLSGLTRVLELLMIIVVGAIVLWVVMSVLLPMVDLMDIVQR